MNFFESEDYGFCNELYDRNIVNADEVPGESIGNSILALNLTRSSEKVQILNIVVRGENHEFVMNMFQSCHKGIKIV